LEEANEFSNCTPVLDTPAPNEELIIGGHLHPNTGKVVGFVNKMQMSFETKASSQKGCTKIYVVLTHCWAFKEIAGVQ
jgi:hypothetical protein